MKKQVTFYYKGEPYTIERGKIYRMFGQYFKIVGKRKRLFLFKLREFKLAESQNFYPVKGEKGVYYFTIRETAALIELNR